MKTAAPERVDLPVSGMTCAACARSIERTLSATPGVDRAHVNLATNTATYIYNDQNGHPLSVAPPNLGPKSTPQYEATFGHPSVFTLANGWRVFAGPRDDAFFFDSGGTFDTLNFRAPAPQRSQFGIEVELGESKIFVSWLFHLTKALSAKLPRNFR